MKPEDKARIELRRERLKELLTNGLSLFAAAKTLFAEGLVPSSNIEAAYQLVRKDLVQIQKTVTKDAARSVEWARELFLSRHEKLYRYALAKMYSDDQSITQGVRLGFLRAAMDANEALAAALNVNIRPRFPMSKDESGFDPAEEAAKEVIAKQEQRKRELESAKTDPRVITINTTPQTEESTDVSSSTQLTVPEDGL